MTTTDTESALLRAVLEEPADDLHRLVLADWWEEAGEAERAEFVRVQLEAARTPVCEHERNMGVAPARCRRCALLCREAWLMGCVSDPGLPAMRPGWHGLPDDWFVTRSPAPMGWRSEEKYTAWVTFHRGFVAEVALPCAAFEAHAAVLFASHPIERVRLVDRSPADVSTEWWWYRGDSPTRWMRTDAPHHLDSHLFDLLTAGKKVGVDVRVYGSAEAAQDALSRACVTHGRELAELPPLLE